MAKIDSNAKSQGDIVTKTDLEKLSKNFFDKVHIRDHHDKEIRQINCDDRNDKKKNDSKSVYFDKAKIDALFANNPGSDGLRIYFGVHDSKIFPNSQPESYDGKIMVVLVSTTNNVDNLDDFPHDAAKSTSGQNLISSGIGKVGLDDGKICPPDTGCK